MSEQSRPAQSEEPKKPSKAKKADVPANFKLVHTLQGHTRAVICAQFSPNEAFLASASGDGTCKLWDSKSGQLLRTLEGHTKGLSAVCWDPESKYVLTASDDKTLRLWQADNGKTLKELTGHTHFVFCCAYSPKGNIVASGGFDEVVRLWDVRDGTCFKTIPAHSDPVTAVDFSPDGTLLVSCSYDGLCRIWNMENAACVASIVDRENPPVSFVKFTPNGQFLLMGTLDHQLKLWNHDKQQTSKYYKGHKNQHHCLFAAFLPHPSQAYIISGSEDNRIFVWSLNSRKELQLIPGRENSNIEGDGHCAPVMSVNALRSGIFASAAHEPDCSVKIWQDDNLVETLSTIPAKN